MAVKPVETKFIFTTELIGDITDKINDGIVVKRHQNPWFKNEVGVRRQGIKFRMTPEEEEEYIKCYLDIKYFAEKYCKIKTEDGSVQLVSLRDYQEDIIDLYMKNRFSILCGSRQIGKALKNDSLVWGIDGKKTIDSLVVGDKIFGDDGKLTNVTGVYPQGIKQLYRVTFSDNTIVECCGEHLWGVYNHGKYKVVELNNIMNNYLSIRGDYNYYIKVAPSVEYEKQDLPIDPYLLGALIGDGGLSNSSNFITSKDYEIIDYFKIKVREYDCVLNYVNKFDYRISTNTKGINKLTNLLRSLNLRVKSELKSIPSKYLISSKEQRVQLLQGLMDTDGYCSKKGIVEFTTISKQLSIDFQELCNSLGIKTRCVNRITSYKYKGIKKNGKLSYRIRLYTNNIDFDIFKLSRKNQYVNKDMKFNWGNYRGIANIEKIEIDKCTCISVDNESKLFLTNNFIPTHNTISAAITMLHFITFNNDKNIMIVANIANTAIEIIDKIKNIYINLPFFLKNGIKNWNQRSMIFENGCRIKSSARSKTPAIGFTIDFLYLDEFAHIPSNIIEPYYTAAFPTVSGVENSKIVITSTPNGMNLFHRLLTDAERPDGDPLKNNYKSMRVYWHQVPGRFVTYLRLNNHKMYEYGVTKEEIVNLVKGIWDKTKIDVKFIADIQKDVIYVHNNEYCKDADVKQLKFIDKNGIECPIQFIAEVTTWKEEAIKDIGGEDAFNQEYDLRFINATRSLLTETLINNLLNNKRNYKFEQIYEFDKKLRFSYADLKWIDDPDVFSPINRKDGRGVISVDISEGLGQDYSVINIFQIAAKSRELIELQKPAYSNISDFFKLEQIGIYRSNYVSIKQLAEILYLIVFEYFNYENFKVVVELNNYGNTLFAELPHVFDGNNNYGSSVFVRYKHRADATEEKVGLKVGDNKNMMVKSYQDAMNLSSISVTNEDNIREITTFVKHITSAGNVRYAADIGNDDSVMTLVNMSSIFAKHEYREMCEEWASKFLDKETLNYINETLKNLDEHVEGVDYSSVIKINRQRKFTSQYKQQINRNTGTSGSTGKWFGI